jgi:predicted amidophosphoribosyltransferase
MNQFIIFSPLFLLALVIVIMLWHASKRRKNRLYQCPACQAPYRVGDRWCKTCHTSLPVVHFARQQRERPPIYSRASRRYTPIFLSPRLPQEPPVAPSEAITQRALPTLHHTEHPSGAHSRQDVATTQPASHLLPQEVHLLKERSPNCTKCHAPVEATALFCGHCGKSLLPRSYKPESSSC